MDRAVLGRSAEDVAADFLSRNDVQILERNFRRRLGEIDIVGRIQDVLIIVEVRTRSSDAFGGAAASVDFIKQRKIIRATQQLLQKRREFAELRVRFDVVVVRDALSRKPEVEWIQHAFEARE
jgi:putative endonuclease